MSTLISRLGRRFREKPKSSNLDLPGLPTPREILEDIEGCQSGDPVITLATLIQRKGRQTSLLDKDFFNDSFSTIAGSTKPSPLSSHLAFLSPYRTSNSTNDPSGDKAISLPFDDSSSVFASGPNPIKRKGSLGMGGGSSSKSSAKKTNSADSEHFLESYNKLKQFLLLYEKSEEILEDLKGHFTRVEKSMQMESCANVKEEETVSTKDENHDVPAKFNSNVKIKVERRGGEGDGEVYGLSGEDFYNGNNEDEKQLLSLTESDVCSSPLL